MTTMTICIGDAMAAQQRQESLSQGAAGIIAPVLRSTSASVAGLHHLQPDQAREEELEAQVRSLEQWICELLSKNQQLRMLLQSETKHQTKEIRHEYDQDVCRD